MNLFCSFARSNSVTARLEPKDDGALVPDAELILSTGPVLTDLSGVWPLAPSHLASHPLPGAAMNQRAHDKGNKYRDHAARLNSRFVPLIVDAFGCMHKDFISLIAEVENEGNQLDFYPSTTRMSAPTFTSIFSTRWQADNARIVYQWLNLCRSR